MANALFWFQMVMAFVYSYPLIRNIITGKTQGLTMAMYAVFMLYLVIGLSLAIEAYRQQRSTIRLQNIIVFANWIVLVGLICVLGCTKVIWHTGDTVFTVVSLALTAMTMLKYRSEHNPIGILDPIGRGWMAVWCKAVPQLWLAYTMLFIAHGSSGFAATSLIAGHVTGISRFVQVYLSGRKDGWDRPTKGLILGEAANISTWAIVTIAWWMVK